ncbi:MAG: ferrous iron transporter B [Anaerolineales bacterium]|nr:ferrous iron transporter B [Anaerolineales bacterium]
MAISVSDKNIVLIGLESVGKSALFRALTGEVTGDETNYRGSTVLVRAADLLDRSGRLVDTPGIRIKEDSETTRLALRQIDQADTIVLVVRGTHAKAEIETLFAEIKPDLGRRKTVLVITFEDRASPELQQLVADYRRELGVPVMLVNARSLNPAQRDGLLQTIRQAAPLLPGQPISFLPESPVIEPQRTPFEQPWLGPWLSLATMALLFALPVYLAYIFADWLQPLADERVITPLVERLAPLERFSPLLLALLAGDYGLITLGWYSFLWAFPVVLLIGISVAVTEEMGLKDRITAALDPWLRRIGLNGRDLIPVLTGFGCNVVAVYESRACSACTRKACISLIAFGSACSYQIGAALSLFNAAQQPWLFAPYLLTLFVVGAIHTRLWHKPLPPSAIIPLAERSFLQGPSWPGLGWRVKAVLKKFLLEAMPVFFVICGLGALLAYVGFLDHLAAWVEPLLALFGLPGEVAPGVIFSIVRKDGLLVLNQDEGALLAALTSGQLFVLVYLGSTLTACLVTLWSIGGELGWGHAGRLAGRQLLTSVVSALVLAYLLNFWV